MKHTLSIITLAAGLFTFGLAQADAMHGSTVGSPGSASEVTRTIHVQASDDMKLVFDRQDIYQGDVVRFVVHNSGKVPHEFGIADEHGQAAHQKAMMAMPGMVHDEANVISLAPGETKTLIWRFTHMQQKHLVFACNVPGHYQAGMVVRLTVQ